MKKRYMMVAFSLALVLGGCGSNAKTNELTLAEDSEQMMDTMQDENEIVEAAAEETVFEGEPVFLFDNEMKSAVCINPNGELIDTLDISDYTNEYMGKAILTINGDDVYHYFYSEDFAGYVIGVTSLSTGEETELMESPDFMYADIYDNMFVVSEYNYPDAQLTEVFFDLNTHEKMSVPNNYCELLAGYSLVRNYDRVESCLERLLDERGVIIVSKDKTYYTFDGESIEELIVWDNGGTVKYYNDDCLIYTKSTDDDYIDDELYMYSIKTGEDKLISDEFSTYLKEENGYIYWTSVDDTDYGRDEYTLYRYGFEEAKVEKLMSEKKTPGHQMSPIVEGFTIDNDRIYYLGGAEDGVLWKMYDIASGQTIDTQAYAKVDEYTGLGSVAYENKVRKCDECGEPLYKCYEEYFVFNDSVMSAEAKDKINNALKAKADEVFKSANEDEMYSGDDYGDGCEYHGQIYSLETSENYVESVYLIGENYVTVNTSGYWYGGGAHGYPLKGNYLFDITTGEKVDIGDLFTGDEWVLKDIVASATKADYEKTNEDGYKYFAESAQTCYQQAYDYIGFGYFPAQWNADGVTIMYPPYEMGSFASGYICIDISYETLGIRDKMLGGN